MRARTNPLNCFRSLGRHCVQLVAVLIGVSASLPAHNIIILGSDVVYKPGTPIPEQSVTVGTGFIPGTTLTIRLQNSGNETDCDTAAQISVGGTPNVIVVHPLTASYHTGEIDHADFVVAPFLTNLGQATVTVSWIASGGGCNGAGAPIIPIRVTLASAPPSALSMLPPGHSYGQFDPDLKPEPVSLTGALYDSFDDLELPGPLPMLFTRYYSSTLGSEGQVTSALGANWMHSFDLRLVVSDTTAGVQYFQGQSIRYSLSAGAWTQTTPDEFAYPLVQSGSTFRFLDPETQLIYTFNQGAGGRLERIEDRSGNALTLTYNGAQLASVADGFGDRFDFTYTGGNLTGVRDQTGRAVSFGYTGSDLTSFTDASGGVTNYSYSTAGGRTQLFVSARLPRGNTRYTQTYDSTGRVATQRDANNNTTTFSYNTSGSNQNSVQDPLSNSAIFRTQNRDLLSLQDPAHNTLTYTYDANSRPLTQTDRLGGRWQFTYHSSGLPASITLPDGSKFTYSYAATSSGGFTFYNPASLTWPDGSSEQYEYDQAGNRTARTDRAGQRWTCTYNTRGQPLIITLPNGATASFTYRNDATIDSVQEPGAGTWRFGYDNLKRVTSITNSDGGVRQFAYDAQDRLVGVTNEAGQSKRLDRDVNGLVSGLVDALGNASTFTHTGTDRISQLTDPLGNSQQIAYDAMDREASLTYADGGAYTFTYDAAGHRISVRDPEGKLWKRTVDANGEVTSYTTPIGNQTTETHDALGRLTGMTSPLGNSYSYTYDGVGRLASITDPLGGKTLLTRDRREDLTRIDLQDGARASYGRDVLGRITSITDPNGNAWQFGYDGGGRLISITDPLGNSQIWTRNAEGLITQAQFPGGGSLKLTNNPIGFVTRAAYSDGTVLDYQYDGRGLFIGGTSMTLQRDARDLITNSNGLTIDRDAVGRIARVTVASGKTITYAYDRRGLVSEVRDWLGGSTRFVYDDDGQLISATRPNGVITRYQYNAEGQVTLIEESRTGTILASTSLTRDKAGQVSRADRNVPLTPTFDPSLEQATHSFDAASQVKEFQYDKMGRRTADDKRSYGWDLASHLTSYTENGSSSQFSYNCVDLLTSETRDGNTRQYVWNYALTPPSISVARQAGSDLRYYVHTPAGDLLYSLDASSNSRRFYHFDEMGNTLFLTDDAGSISDSYAYTPYGAPVTSLGLTDNPFTFGGRHGVHRLGLTNLYVMCRRVYDSSNATFLSREPSVQIDPRLVNPYQYAAANPLYFIDPTGREPEASPAHEPGTGAGVETAVTVVGKSADVAVQVGEHLSEGKKITEALVHASDYIQIDNVKEANDVFKVVMKDAPKVAKGEKIVKVAAPIKTAAQVAEGGLIVKEFIDARDEAFHEDEIRTSTSEKLYNKLANRANALYDRKLIGAARKNNLIKKALIDLTYDQAVSNSVLDLELTAQFGVGVKNAVGTLVPIPKPVLGWFGLNPEDKLKKK